MSELIIQDNNALALKAELDTQIATAKAYPRDVKRSIDEATTLATIDEDTAQGCFYALPRKDKDGNKITIEGESIRLAEIIRCSWGHMHTQTRIVEVAEKHITTEAVAWDLQSNNKHIATDRISIWFGEKSGKGGYRANNDMQIMLAKASQAKALRNAIFQVVPKGLVKVVSAATKKFALGGSENLTVKVTKAVNKLVKMGLNKEEMLAYFEKQSLNDFTEDDYLAIIGIGTALKEGLIKPEEVFLSEKLETESASDKLNDLIASKQAPKLDNQVNASTGEVIDSDLPY